jgi:hypothetical protein
MLQRAAMVGKKIHLWVPVYVSLIKRRYAQEEEEEKEEKDGSRQEAATTYRKRYERALSLLAGPRGCDNTAITEYTHHHPWVTGAHWPTVARGVPGRTPSTP